MPTASAIPPVSSCAPISGHDTRQRLAHDRARLLAALREAGEARPWLWCHPSWQAVWLHRWSHYHFVHGRRLLARALWHLNLLLTGADISPQARIGGGLLLTSPATLILLGRFGEDLTVMPQVGVGGGIAREDIGGGPGLPVIGDGVHLGFACTVLGPVRIGDRAEIGARCLVTRDVPTGARLLGPEPRLVRGGQAATERADA